MARIDRRGMGAPVAPPARRGRLRLIAMLMLAMAATACAGPAHVPSRSPAPATSTETTTRPVAEPRVQAPGAPPSFQLLYDGHRVTLPPHTWCYDHGCVDGVPGEPTSVGSPAEIRIVVPVQRWDLTASLVPAGERCGRRQDVDLTRDADGMFVLTPHGHAGTYDVDLFAHGGGDMAARFRWTTPADGPLPAPTARLAVVAMQDGRADSYGVEFAVDNLDRTPDTASARISVIPRGGRSVSFTATRSRMRCLPVGSIYFDGPDAAGKAAANAGRAPFRYRVRLILNGDVYRASAVYPRDVIGGNAPSVALAFRPSLPSPR